MDTMKRKRITRCMLLIVSYTCAVVVIENILISVNVASIRNAEDYYDIPIADTINITSNGTKRNSLQSELELNLRNSTSSKSSTTTTVPSTTTRKYQPPPPTKSAAEIAAEEKYYRKQPTKVNPYLYDYVINGGDICTKNTYLVIIVHSFHPYTDRRAAIRETWGSVVKGKWPNLDIKPEIRLAFMIAQHGSQKWNDHIRNESAIHKDIIMGNFMDAYKNMTLKSLLGLKWVSEHCPSATYLLKSDDDMFINLPLMVDILQQRNFKRGVMGPYNPQSRVYRTGKWKLTKEEFPFKFFPPYEAGAAYIISADVVKELFEASEYVPPIFIDDVYITGILGRIIGLEHFWARGFAFWTGRPPTRCQIISNFTLTGTKMKPPLMKQLWEHIHLTTPPCPNITEMEKEEERRNAKRKPAAKKPAVVNHNIHPRNQTFNSADARRKAIEDNMNKLKERAAMNKAKGQKSDNVKDGSEARAAINKAKSQKSDQPNVGSEKRASKQRPILIDKAKLLAKARDRMHIVKLPRKHS